MSSFNLDLCKALTLANISLIRSSTLFFIIFWNSIQEKIYLINRQYAKTIYQSTERNNKSNLKLRNWQENLGFNWWNNWLRMLLSNEPGKILLLTSEQLERANFSTISKLFDKLMNLLRPNSVHHDNVLLFLIDAAPFIVKPANSFKDLFSKMVHVTCSVHVHHRVAEKIRDSFKNVYELMSNAKKIYLKASVEYKYIKTKHPECHFSQHL